MRLLWFALSQIVETLLRFFPFPCKIGLTKIGDPGRDSPVFLTCNYHLTVQRVKRALKGIDAYLLVANSRGINVWCASAGGHLTSHDVISVLKTSGIEDLIEKRQVVLPQLAAVGVEAKVVHSRAGWEVIWGPAYAKDIPLFLNNALNKTARMREVRFPFTQRLEVAAAWAFPVSLILSLIMIPFWRKFIFPLIILVWGLSFMVFLSFPIYSRWMISKRGRKASLLSVFRRGGFPLILWIGIILSLVAYSIFIQDFPRGFIFRWSFLSFVVLFILGLDLAGSTPVYKSGLHEERELKVVFEEKKCQRAGFCVRVCPRSCFGLDGMKNVAIQQMSERCVRCGACIVQCPFDALSFESPERKKIPPEVLRRFKLSLLGSRLVKTDERKRKADR